MVTISTIVDDILHTRTLTMAQRKDIGCLLNCSQCTEEDERAMLRLIDALSNNSVDAICD